MKKVKKILCIAAACTAILGTSAMARDNEYAYNKFVSTVLAEQIGICDFSASFAGQQGDVNDYFKGLISAFTYDFNNDGNNELVTVDDRAVTAYMADSTGVHFVDEYRHDLIGYGDSYANVFVKVINGVKYICVETVENKGEEQEYKFNMFYLDKESNEFKSKIEIEKTRGNEVEYQSISKDGIAVYSFSYDNGMRIDFNPNGYKNYLEAAKTVLNEVGFDDYSLVLYDRMRFFDGEIVPVGLSDEQISKINNVRSTGNYRITELVGNIDLQTYIRGTGVGGEHPVVYFEDHSRLGTLMVKPDIVTVTVNGEKVEFLDQEPIIKDERTLVPVRGIFEALGAEVEWNQEEMKVTANRGGKTIEMTVGSDKFYVNGEERTLDVPAEIINDRTLVPVRAISESFDCKVDWNQETQTVIITMVE